MKGVAPHNSACRQALVSTIQSCGLDLTSSSSFPGHSVSILTLRGKQTLCSSFRHSLCKTGRTDTGEPGRVCDGIRTRDYVYRRGKYRQFLVDENLGCEREERKRGGRAELRTLRN